MAAATAATPDLPPDTSTQHRWILWNREAAHGIQLPGKREAVSKTLTPGSRIDLIPGWNPVDVDLWTIAKKNPLITMRMKLKIAASAAPEQNPERVGHFELVEGPLLDREDPLKGVDPETAVDMVGDILDTRLLKRLLDVEQRPTVSGALREALDKIEKAGRTKGSK